MQKWLGTLINFLYNKGMQDAKVWKIIGFPFGSSTLLKGSVESKPWFFQGAQSETLVKILGFRQSFWVSRKLGDLAPWAMQILHPWDYPHTPPYYRHTDKTLWPVMTTLYSKLKGNCLHSANRALNIDWACLCLGFVLKRTYFAHLLGNLFGHLVPISNEGPKLFGRSSLQNECQTQAPPLLHTLTLTFDLDPDLWPWPQIKVKGN